MRRFVSCHRHAAGCLAVLLLVTRPDATIAHESLDPAIGELTRAIAAAPQQGGLYLQRAELRRLAGAWDDAEDDLALAGRRGAPASLVSRSRAALALDRGRPTAALEALAPLEAEPHALRLRARALSMLDRLEEAADALAAAIAVSVTPSPDDVIERAGLLRRLSEHGAERALAALDEGIARLGPLVSLEDAAIEIERTLGRDAAARARLDRLGPQFAPRGDAIPAHAPVSDEGAIGRQAPAVADATTATALTRGPYLGMCGPDRIVVRWRTSTPTDSRVLYGPAPDQLSLSESVAAPTTEHEVALGSLEPHTRYYYAVGTADTVLAGGEEGTRFVTAPLPGSQQATRVWVIGDSGSNNAAAHSVRDAYRKWSGSRDTDVWLMLGDNAYGAGTDAEYQSGVFTNYPEMLRQVAAWPTRGNHDVLYSGPNNDYYDFFTLPTAGQFGGLASGTEAYYSFDYANVHFICLDSEGTDRSPGGAMMRWLRDDAAATTQDWVVAYWHHPPYTKGSHDSDDAYDSAGRMRDMRENALPILDSIGVDLVLAGHSHSYERSYLLNGHYGLSTTLTAGMKVDSLAGRPDGTGPYRKDLRGSGPFSGAVYVVAGSAAQTSGGSLNHPVMVASLNTLGSLVLDVQGQRLDARFLDGAGAVRDSFRIVKGGALTSAPPAVAALRLAAARPNPSHDVTRFAFELPTAGAARLDVLDVGGRHVATVASGTFSAGRHAAAWAGRDDSGAPVAPGAYFAVLEHAGRRVVTRIARLR